MIRDQEEARQKLRQEFQLQQQLLMKEIMSQFPNLELQSSNNEASAPNIDEVEAAMEKSLSLNLMWTRM